VRITGFGLGLATMTYYQILRVRKWNTRASTSR
jgi:hypothetical protein